MKAECAIINSGELTEDQLNCRIANETNGLVRSLFQVGISNAPRPESGANSEHRIEN